jgi:hypothetical protein
MKAMGKIIKIFLLVGASAVITFAQVIDTTSKQDSVAQGIKATPSTGEKKAVTNIKPKATNWSKVKDLFL